MNRNEKGKPLKYREIERIYIIITDWFSRRVGCSPEEEDAWSEDLSPLSFCECSKENVSDCWTHSPWFFGNGIHSHSKRSPGDPEANGKVQNLTLEPVVRYRI